MRVRAGARDAGPGTPVPALGERWSGTRWLTTGSANPSSNDGFNGVSCSSSTLCKPVGYEVVHNAVYDSLIERSA